MADMHIWQVPLVGGKSICPVCGNVVHEQKAYEIAVTYPDRSKEFRECMLFYCPNCDIPLANHSVCKQVFHDSGAWMTTFYLKKSRSLVSVQNQMYHQKKDKTNEHPHKIKYPFELVNNDYDIWKHPKTIYELPKEEMNCPKCDSPLVDDYTLIPVGNDMKAKVPGRLCTTCKTFYVANAESVAKIMQDNPFSKGFRLNGCELWNVTQQERKRQINEQRQEMVSARKEQLSKVSGAVVMICIQFQNQPVKECIITNDKTCHNGEDVFHYTSVEGRELLSAAFAKQRSRKGTLHNNRFKVKDKVFQRDSGKAFKLICPYEVEIRTGGGYSSSIKNKTYEIIDLLLYSPFSQRYELIHATLDKVLESCFIDVGLYRQFIWEYGNPGIELLFEKQSSRSGDFGYLREESALKAYGYSVSEKDNLSAAERQGKLSEIIDLGILEIPKIVSYLDWFFRMHPADKYYYDRERWTEDRKFVENYKANPQRFLIAPTKSKKEE